MTKKRIIIALGVAVIIGAAVVAWLVWGSKSNLEEELFHEEVEVETLYGIEVESYDLIFDRIGNGQTMGKIFEKYGIGAGVTDAISRKADSVYSFRKVRAGNDFCVFMTRDSVPKLSYFVYEIDRTKFLVVDITKDSINVYQSEKEIVYNRVMRSGEINSSLWNAAVEAGMSGALAMELSDIFAWSIDFFALQKGDKFGLIYDERIVDSVVIGGGNIWGAWFDQGTKRYYAIPFEKNGKISYWDENGNSQRKNFLKAPLSFTRISSKFTNARMHPILRIVRPHHGVDYAAPSGTEVYAIGDGVISFKGWAGGGGNTLKIRHTTGNLTSSYMHLRGYASGITNGKRVKQGELIGYVGSTGLSSGPHLDFRVYRGTTAIDPLKIPSEPAEPIAERDRAAFNVVRDRVIAVFDGQMPADSLIVDFSNIPTVESSVADSVPATSESK